MKFGRTKLQSFEDWAFEVKENFFQLVISSNKFELILNPAGETTNIT